MLDIGRYLTLELFLQVDSLGTPQGLLSNDVLNDGTTERVPYALSLDSAGPLNFAFEDKDGQQHSFSATTPLVPNKFYRVAVMRSHHTEAKKKGTAEKSDVSIDQWAGIRFYIRKENASKAQAASRPSSPQFMLHP